MNLICDFLVLAFVFGCIYKGKKNGAVKTFFSFFGNVISFVLTLLFVKPVAAFFTNQIFFPLLKKRFLSAFAGDGSDSALIFDFDSLSESAKTVFSGLGLNPDKLNRFVEETGANETDSLADSLSQYAVMPFAEAVGYACALLALFVVFSILIRILVRVLDLVTKVPGLRFANSVLGLVFGAFEGVLLAMIFATFMTYFAPAIQGNELEFFQNFDPDRTLLLRYFACLDWIRPAVLKG